MTRRLALLQSGSDRLEFPTILDRGLALLHGSDYVRLCAFAIDIDRIYVVSPDSPARPFAWEVFLTECFALHAIEPAREAHHNLLEETCLSILEQSPDDQGYGSQLLFSVYDAVARGLYPESLQPLFRTWRKKPKQLLKALDKLWEGDALNTAAALAAHCTSPAVAGALVPPLTPTTRAALLAMQTGSYRLPERAPTSRRTDKRAR